MDMDFIDYINANDCPKTSGMDFDSIVSPLMDKFIPIHFFEDEIIHIRNFAKEASVAKLKEPHYQIDDGSLEKRFFTGFLGELAVSMILEGFKLDLTIGDSSKFNLPDISRHNMGIKTVEWGKFPIVHKRPKRSEIICILERNIVYVCGIASIDNMKKNSSDELILSKNLRDRNVKTGFHGFADLRFFNKETVEKRLKSNGH